MIRVGIGSAFKLYVRQPLRLSRGQDAASISPTFSTNDEHREQHSKRIGSKQWMCTEYADQDSVSTSGTRQGGM